MTTFLTDLRTRIRTDLHDEDSNSYRWTDEALDRHIERALQEFSLASPAAATTTIEAAAGVYEYDLSEIEDLKDRPQAITAVELPYIAGAALDPAGFVHFRVYANVLYLQSCQAPVAGESIRLWYTTPHVLTETSETLAADDEAVVALGAAAYAALERGMFSVERITPTGHAAEDYRAWGQAALERFTLLLATRQRQSDVAVDGRVTWTFEG